MTRKTTAKILPIWLVGINWTWKTRRMRELMVARTAGVARVDETMRRELERSVEMRQRGTVAAHELNADVREPIVDEIEVRNYCVVALAVLKR